MAASSQNTKCPQSKLRGYTLIEILIVVALLGLLAAVAIPSYMNSVVASNRSVAKSALLDLANRQEQFYLDNRTYSSEMTDLGYPAGMVFNNEGNSAVALNSNQTLVASTSAERLYFVQIDVANSTTFAVSAAPQLSQAEDVSCGTLSLTSYGVKAETGIAPASACW